MFGLTGGPERGLTSHFVGPNKLFPREKMHLVILSDIGMLTMFYIFYAWAQATSAAEVMAVYGGT